MSNFLPTSPYFLVARLLPAIIGSVPFFVFYRFFLHPWLGDLSQSFLSARWPGDVTGSVALIYLLVLAGRSVAKDIFERMQFGRDETHMPTTDSLLHSSNEYTASFLLKIHERIATNFGITILTAEAEITNEEEARKTIAEAVALIRQRVKDGRLVLQHNMEYGFFRNLIGCSVLAVLMSLINVLIFSWLKLDYYVLVVSIATTVTYLVPILLSKLLMNVHGKRYARVLIQEYLAS